MKKLTIFLTQILACGLLAAPSSAQFIPQATAIPGSAPEGINYQGRLEDGGFPVNATKSMIFRVYSAPAGGVLLWTSPAQAVSVALGLFSAVVPVPTTVLVGGGARYLEVSIDGTLMSPRELLNSVPYALIAKSVEGNIDVSTAGLAINANSTAPQPALYISSVTGNVGIGTGAPITAFDVGGSAQFGSGTTKSTFSATGALNTAGKITAPDYTATYGLSAATASFSGSVRIIGELNGGAATTAGLFQLGAGPNGFDGARINLCGSANAACSGTGAAQYFTKGNGTADHSWYSDQGGGTVEKMRLTAPGSLSVAQGITASSVTISHPIHTSALTANNGTMRTSIYQGAIGNQTAGAIGTDTNHPLCLYTAGSACQVKLDQSGVIYIATTTQPTSYANAMNIVHSANATEDGSGGVGLGIYNSFSNATVGRGGILGLGGVTSGMVGPAWNFATIYGFRENAAPTNTAGYFGIATNPNGGLAIERMRITSTGNVGIGTTGPASIGGGWTPILEVSGTAPQLVLRDTTASADDFAIGADANAIYFRTSAAVGDLGVWTSTGNFGIGTVSPGAKLEVKQDVGSTYAVKVSSNDGTGMVVVNNQGNVGVGISPTARLQVTSSGAGTAKIILNDTLAGGSSFSIQGGPGVSRLAIGADAGTGATERMTITAEGASAGNVGIGTTAPASKLHMSSGTIIVDGNAATALTTVGNAGIGTAGAVPADRLEVAGGNIRLTVVAGSNGSVKLFSTLTVGAVTCTAQCGANTLCLAAWDSAGVISTCGTATAANRCLCSGFGN